MAPVPNQTKIVLVTGANQGLGHAVIEVAGLRYPENVYVLCSRELEKGKDAARKLSEELGVKARVDVLQLDVTNDDDVAAAVEHVGKTYGRLDVLVNNAGILRGMGMADDTPPVAIRSIFNEVLSVHITSVAVVTLAFKQLLHRSPAPKVINVTSGLGSITNVLTPGRRMARTPAYGASKVGMNGLTAHLQVGENDRAAAQAVDHPDMARIHFYISNPGVLSTNFTGFHPMGGPPQQGAESIVRILADDEGSYDGAMQWEYVDGEMRQVPW
ncbi:short chain dehydrogenase/reductase family protein [Lasiosphaeria hispida]|uniref:Short chain dehydrogenase/reductase family protein n=1 Tax=Lasiosphaeria hispida TaxID=260671 RepID=A0AAJ0MIU2_9PEZI|nr:short chain dehydrogenase/reductase family protein [Lasiosphaeria hispida]